MVAGRLSKNPNWKVLLIEAGPEQPSSAAIPALLGYTWRSNLDWQYVTEPTEGGATACLSNEHFQLI